VKRYLWILNLGLILIALLLAAVLVSGHRRSPVFAQTTGEVGNIIAFTGGYRALDDEPLFLIDTKDQVLMAYAYQISENRLDLRSVRRYEYDMLEKDANFNPIGGGKSSGPGVEAVKKLIEKEAQK